MSFGTGPFGSFGFGLPAVSTNAAERGRIVSSRQIGPDGQYVQSGDDAGSFAGMTDTQQRVVILTSFVKEPLKQGADFVRVIQDRIRAALSPLTARPNPTIRITEILVQQFASGTKKTVRFVDLTSGERFEQDV